MTWQPISTAPMDGTHILICYFKKGKGYRTRVDHEWIITEASFVPTYYADWDTKKKHLFGGEWVDALDRLICDTKAKKSSSDVAWWMPLPAPPEAQ